MHIIQFPFERVIEINVYILQTGADPLQWA
jgi:hypothetical protein